MVRINFSRKNKIFIRAYLEGNVGDDLFIRTLVKRYPKEKFEIYVEKNFSESFLDLDNVHISYKNFLKKGLNFIERKTSRINFLSLIFLRYKAIIEIGGSIFQQVGSNCDLSDDRKYLMRLAPHYFIIGSNFGPYNDKKYTKTYMNFFSKVDGVVMRDRYSFELFKKLNNVNYAPDVIFNYPISRKHVNDNFVSIVPVNLNYSKRPNFGELEKYNSVYIDWLVNLTKYCLKRKWKVNLISFCTREGDGNIIDVILSKLDYPDRQNITVFKHNNVESKIDVISSSKYLISSRFHSMIIGWKCQTNQIVIPYSKKVINVIKDLYPNQMTIKLEDLNSKKYEQVFKLANTMPKHILRKCELAASLQFVYTDKFIKKTKGN